MKKLLFKNLYRVLKILFKILLNGDSKAKRPIIQKNNKHINTNGL